MKNITSNFNVNLNITVLYCVHTPFLMQSDGKKGMSYLLDEESPIIKPSGNSKGVSSILCLFGSGKSFF